MQNMMGRFGGAFPAHAGMNRARRRRRRAACCVPRTRGDEPDAADAAMLKRMRSPHTRG